MRRSKSAPPTGRRLRRHRRLAVVRRAVDRQDRRRLDQEALCLGCRLLEASVAVRSEVAVPSAVEARSVGAVPSVEAAALAVGAVPSVEAAALAVGAVPSVEAAALASAEMATDDLGQIFNLTARQAG